MKLATWIKMNMSRDDWVLLTGASSAIGLEYLRFFCENGCNVLCVSNEMDEMDKNKANFSSYGNKIENHEMDLSNPEETKAGMDKLASYNVKILVNNAGFGLKGRFESHEVDRYIDIVSVNAIAPVVATHKILPSMQKNDCGIIIHVASINAYIPIPTNQVYTATKAFCMSYSLAVSRENKKSRIKFQLVLPGTTKTPFHDKQGANPSNLVMTPDVVVQRSIENINKEIVIPNPADRALPTILNLIPKNLAMDIAEFMVRKRLGL